MMDSQVESLVVWWSRDHNALCWSTIAVAIVVDVS